MDAECASVPLVAPDPWNSRVNSVRGDGCILVAGFFTGLSHLQHVQSWWNFRHLPNIIFVHYADLLADLEGGIRRVADFLEMKVPESAWPTIVRDCTFAEMKAHGDRYAPPGIDSIFKGGSQTFFHKGTNNRWRELLSAEELALYDIAARRALTPECRQWLEHGARIARIDSAVTEQVARR